MSTDWLGILGKVAPTVVSAVGSPLAGAALMAIGEIFGVKEPTQEKISEFFQNGQLTSDHIFKLRELEAKYKNDEAERGFKYEELTFKDRDSARTANVAGGTQRMLFWLSLLLLFLCIGAEIWVLFKGIPPDTQELVAGRILGMLDAIALTVMNYWYGSTNGSARKTDMLAKAEPIK